MPPVDDAHSYNLEYSDFVVESMTLSEKIVASKFDSSIPTVLLEVVDDIKRFRGNTNSVGNSPRRIEYTLPSESLYKTHTSLYWLVRCIANIEHECSHVYDRLVKFNDEKSKYSIIASMEDLVFSSNPVFEVGIKGTDTEMANYCHCINEVNAEYNAMIYGMKDMQKRFPLFTRNVLEKTFVDVFNNRISECKPFYCLSYGNKIPIVSWEEIPQRYRASVEAAYTVPFVYDIYHPDNYDFLAHCLKSNLGNKYVKRSMSTNDPIRQIRYFASFCATYENGLLVEDYPNLRHLDLSVSHSDRMFPFLVPTAIGNMKVVINDFKSAIDNIIDDSNYNDFQP